MRDRLPGKALLGLFLTGFVGILTECLPAGLLPDMARSLRTNVALTGQTVTLYAAATSIAAIPLSRAFSRWPRKTVLLVALATVAGANTLTALSDNYPLTLVIRFVAGLGTGMIWPQLGGYAARLAPGGQQGRAITVALAGTPIGLALGVPLGPWLSTFGGWQVAFHACAGLTDRHLRKLVVGSTVLFAISVLVLAVLSGMPLVVYIAVGAWGFAFGSSASLFIGAAAVIGGKRYAFP